MSDDQVEIDDLGINSDGSAAGPRVGVPELLDDAADRLNLALDALVACGLAAYYLDGVVGDYRADASALYEAADEIRADHRRPLR